MKVKVTNFQMLNAVQALGSLGNEKLPVKAAFAITKNLRVIQENLNDMEETRKKLLGEHAEAGDDGNPKTDDEGAAVFPDDDAREAFMKAVTDLYNEEVEVDVRKIKVDDFGSAELTMQQILLLDFIVDEE